MITPTKINHRIQALLAIKFKNKNQVIMANAIRANHAQNLS
jgi:hypothetical protein